MSARTEIVIKGITEATKKKLFKLKDQQGFGDKDFGEWFTFLVADVKLQDSMGEAIQKNTRDGLLKLWLQNLSKNLPAIWEGETIASLVPKYSKELEAQGQDPDMPVPGKSAIVIGRGPSVFKKKHLELLAQSDYAGTIVCSDGALIDALKAGVRPDKYEFFGVMSVDGHPEKIAAWYEHDLVKKYGSHISAVLCSSCSPSVVETCKRNGVKVYFMHPLFDDHRNIESYTKVEQFMTMCEKHPNGVPCMSAGGNAGSAAWILSWVVLRRNPVCLIGMDLGYLDDDDLTKTYYWKGIMEATKDNAALAESQYERIFNPDWGTYAKMDPVFKTYREGLLYLVQKAPYWVRTQNATEGGSLFGEGIEPIKFKDWLEQHKT